MKQVYKICTACMGEGSVESPPGNNTKITIDRNGVKEQATEKRGNITCYVCKGRTIIPSGFFILEEQDEGVPITAIIETLHEDHKKAIINRT